MAPRFFIVVPVLREAGLLRDAVAHLQAVACEHTATVVVVTTAREAAEAHRYPAAGDTVSIARQLASEGKCVHLHYPDPLGLKADQLNYAVAACARLLPAGMPSSRAFAVCYDADSRPPPDASYEGNNHALPRESWRRSAVYLGAFAAPPMGRGTVSRSRRENGWMSSASEPTHLDNHHRKHAAPGPLVGIRALDLGTSTPSRSPQ